MVCSPCPSLLVLPQRVLDSILHPHPLHSRTTPLLSLCFHAGTSSIRRGAKPAAGVNPLHGLAAGHTRPRRPLPVEQAVGDGTRASSRAVNSTERRRTRTKPHDVRPAGARAQVGCIRALCEAFEQDHAASEWTARGCSDTAILERRHHRGDFSDREAVWDPRAGSEGTHSVPLVHHPRHCVFELSWCSL